MTLKAVHILEEEHMKKIIKFLTLILALSSVGIVLTACGSSTPKADYTEVKAEKALNAGKDIKGKTVSIEVAKLEPRSAFGYNIEAGKHLNFVSEENPDVKVGDKLIVKVKKVKSVIGSFVINYDLIHKTKGKKISNNKKKVATSKNKKSSLVKPDPNASKRTWTYKDNVFDAGIETYKFTKSEVRDSAADGKKVLVLYCDVTNNSKKEQDPSNIYMVVHAHQKTDTADKQLDPGTNALDENANDPLQKYSDALHDNLLPGKTTHAVIMFELVNDKDVVVEFENANFKTIGKKTYSVKDSFKNDESNSVAAASNSVSNSTSSSTVAQSSSAVQSTSQTKQVAVKSVNNNNQSQQIATSSSSQQTLSDFVNEHGMSPAAYKMQHDGMSQKEALDSTPRGMKSSGEIQMQNELNKQQ